MRIYLINKKVLRKRKIKVEQLPLKNGSIFLTEKENFTPLPHFYSAKEVFVFGGDGTINSVISKLTPDQLLVPIPMGSGNDFVRKLGYNTNWKKALFHFLKKRVLQAKEVKIALCETDALKKPVLNSLGFGLDQQVNESEGKNYVEKFLKALPKIRPHRFILRSNSLPSPREFITEWLLVTVGPFIGNGLRVHNPNLSYDSLLITVFKNHPSALSRTTAYAKWKFLNIPPFSQQFTATEVEIIPPYNLKPVVDGTVEEKAGKIHLTYPYKTIRVDQW